jgi:mitochondrial chaperone BCS1
LVVSSSWSHAGPNYFEEDEAPEDDDGPKKKMKFAPGPGNYCFRYNRRLLWLNRERVHTEGARAEERDKEYIRIRCLGRNQRFLRELLLDAQKLSKANTRAPRIWISTGGEWRKAGNLPCREFESVVFPDDAGERLLADVKSFLGSKRWYQGLGVPYRRGYLLYGPPGTGKSSSIVALGYTLKKDVYVLNLGSKTMSDENVQNLLSDVPHGALVVLEDIDCATKTRDGDSEKGKDTGSSLTLSGLLNAIDGVAATEGRLLMMTTNHVDRLDPALVRKGRVDLHLRLDYATPEQIEKLFLRFYPDAFTLAQTFVAKLSGLSVVPATLQEHFVTRRDLPDLAVRETHLITGVSDVRSEG